MRILLLIPELTVLSPIGSDVCVCVFLNKSGPQGNLVMEQDFGEGKVHIRHGKMSKSRFSVDFRHPVSPIVALGVCCSTFANKMVVT